MSKKSAASFFLIDELVSRVNAQLPADQQVTERTVRYYMSNNLIGKGLKISELPEEFSLTISQRGNQRYFTSDDCDVVVATRAALANGLTIAQSRTFNDTSDVLAFI